jgi:hypothetical protein
MDVRRVFVGLRGALVGFPAALAVLTRNVLSHAY